MTAAQNGTAPDATAGTRMIKSMSTRLEMSLLSHTFTVWKFMIKFLLQKSRTANPAVVRL